MLGIGGPPAFLNNERIVIPLIGNYCAWLIIVVVRLCSGTLSGTLSGATLKICLIFYEYLILFNTIIIEII